MNAGTYRSPRFYTAKATRIAFLALAVTSMLQLWLIIQACVITTGALSFAWLVALSLLVLLSNLIAGFVFSEMLRDSDQYRPRFARAGWIHALMTAGISASMLIQMSVEGSGISLPPLLETAGWLKLTITFAPLLLISHAGTYVLVNTQPHQPYFTQKYGYPKVLKRSKRER